MAARYACYGACRAIKDWCLSPSQVPLLYANFKTKSGRCHSKIGNTEWGMKLDGSSDSIACRFRDADRST